MIAAIAAIAPLALSQQPVDLKTAQAGLAQLPWPVRLGGRVHLINEVFPLIDRVVLVPDAATYVDELSKWSPRGRWPVLIEDRQFTPMFIRRFKPAQVIRRDPVGHALPDDVKNRRKIIESVVAQAFGGDPAKAGIQDILAAQQYVPPGIVIASTSDPAWTAAVALAAGHGELLAWLDEPFGGPDDELDDPSAQKLVAAVNGLVAAQSNLYQYKSLGDDLDAITVCRSIAVRARVNLPPSVRAKVGGPNAEGPVAVTDLLGRNSDGSRYAFVGWIFGDEIRSAYMAMCSLFLPRDRAWMFNTYPENGEWNIYATDKAAMAMGQQGYEVQQADRLPNNGPKSNDDKAWLRVISGGLSSDLVVINTKGNNDFFDLSSGSAYPDDVPILNEPAALHLIHSWSMQYPQRSASVGGKWLDRGVYAAVGSCWEPYLGAFVPPTDLANRWINFVPFLMSGRQWQGPLASPWRVVTIGDPLLLCGSPQRSRKQRIAQPADYGTDLTEHAKTLMRAAQTEQTDKSFAQAIQALTLIGSDEVAIGMWNAAASVEKKPETAREALGPLFRRRDVDEFLRAWAAAAIDPATDAAATDMLWHLLTPRLVSGGSIDNQTLQILESAVRPSCPHHDLQRLAPSLARAFGNPRVLEAIQRHMKKTPPGPMKQALAELMNKY